MSDTTVQHIAARDDQDLVARLVATAEMAGIPNPRSFVQETIGRLVSVEIQSGTTLTSVHAYATAVYDAAVAALPPAPGLDPSAVTDVQLEAAVQAVWNPSA